MTDVADATIGDEATTGAFQHVRKDMHEFLAIEDGSRIDACWNKIWIHTDDTREAFRMLKECVNAYPSTKPEGGVITGASDTGKTYTMRKFRDFYAPTSSPDHEYAEHPAIYMLTPDKLNRAGFYKQILAEVGFPILYNANETDLRNHAIRMLKECRVGTVMMDELHDIGRETGSQTVEYLRFIKGLVNASGRPFVVGGETVILDLLLSERQMVGRFDNVVTLKALKIREFVKFLLAFETMLPLRLSSDLRRNEGLVQALWSQTDGYVGKLSRLLKAVSRAAIESKEERISAKLLEKVSGRGLKAASANL